MWLLEDIPNLIFKDLYRQSVCHSPGTLSQCLVLLSVKSYSTFKCLWIRLSFCSQRPNLAVLLFPESKCSLLSGAIFLLRHLCTASSTPENQAETEVARARWQKLCSLPPTHWHPRRGCAPCLCVCCRWCPRPRCHGPPRGSGGAHDAHLTQPAQMNERWCLLQTWSFVLTQAAKVQELCPWNFWILQNRVPPLLVLDGWGAWEHFIACMRKAFANL